MPRLVGFMREPGLMAPMFIWAIYVAGRLKNAQHALATTIAVLGAAGLPIDRRVRHLGGAGRMYVRHWRCPAEEKNFRVTRQFLGMALLIGGVWLAIFAPVWGLKAKKKRSIPDRSQIAPPQPSLVSHR